MVPAADIPNSGCPAPTNRSADKRQTRDLRLARLEWARPWGFRVPEKPRVQPHNPAAGRPRIAAVPRGSKLFVPGGGELRYRSPPQTTLVRDTPPEPTCSSAAADCQGETSGQH